MKQISYDAFAVPTQAPLEFTVVVPTLNERGNIATLLERLAFALAEIEWEAVVVDDGSTDGTAEFLTELSRSDRRVRLIRRVGRRGLSSAVVEGMLASTAPIVAVIDADLQHDERILPNLYAVIAGGDADLAVATRYAQGGSTGIWTRHRRTLSRVATRLAASVVNTPLSDPMSGFFAIERECLLRAVPHLSGVGYKLLLDIAASSPTPLRVREHPYTFRTRDAGDSKLDGAIALQYLELLVDKSIGRWLPSRLLKFLVVGLLGLAVHLGILSACMVVLGLRFQIGQGVALVSAITFNFALNNCFTYRDRRLHGWPMVAGLVRFAVICSAGAAANIGISTMAYHDGSPWWLAGIAGAAAASVWNYSMATLFGWRRS